MSSNVSLEPGKWRCGLCKAINDRRHRKRCYRCDAEKGGGLYYVPPREDEPEEKEVADVIK